jgi:hypothetical protein
VRRLQPQRPLSHIAQQIKTLAKAGAISFDQKNHALDEAVKDGFTIADIKYALERCVVIEDQGNSKYRCEGRTVDGTPMNLITRLRVIMKDRQDVLVITVWKITARK